MKILVTGGAGFIGSHLCDRLLESGSEVIVLDNLDGQVHDGVPAYLSSDVELRTGDVRDRAEVRAALDGADVLVHLAAAVGVGQSMYEIERYTSVNALGAAIVLEEAIARRDHLEKVVVASSMSIYGEGLYVCPAESLEVAPPTRPAEQLERREWEPICPSCGGPLVPQPTPESKMLRPTSIYAIGKRDHEEMFLAWGQAYGVPTTALRFFNVYGPRQSLSNPYTGVAAIFASRLLNGRPPVIFEDGRQSRDFIHVRDIAAGIELALAPGRADGLAVNLGTGNPVTVNDVAVALGNCLDVEIAPDVVDQFRAGDIRHCYSSIALATAELGFTPAVAFEDGIRELSEWLVDQPADDRVDEATAALRVRGLAR